MGYNKDLITPLPLFSTNFTTSHTLDLCNNNESRNDELIITGSAREPKEREQYMQSRWNPTPEQMLALEEVYSSGTRTPTTQQIQEIACKLQKYGRIEGKNVFYWFQNHKSRERLKRRRPDQQGFAISNVHEDPLCKDNVVVSDNNDSSSVLRRRGDHQVIHKNTCFSSSFTHLQNNNNDEGKTKECETGLVEVKEANYHLIITSKRDQNEEEEEEEAIRKSRTLDLFPVIENQEKTGFEKKNTKQNQVGCNNYYYYEFMPLMK